ncbi:uncharacterized protein [Rutidosis leptorrhynchoides]|uniref:uncharacterized protein n=1 Tax=Rutidosis leptorrhynchoides TaxID=125765 RepID=UPI003A992221
MDVVNTDGQSRLVYGICVSVYKYHLLRRRLLIVRLVAFGLLELDGGIFWIFGRGLRTWEILGIMLLWRWRFLSRPDEYWVSIIKSIHGDVFEMMSSNGSSTWNNIVTTCLKSITDGHLPSDVFRMEVGNGRNVGFWHDLWCGNSTLSSRYNRLFHLDVNKDDTVADKWVNGAWQWTWARENLGSRNEQMLSTLCDDLMSFRALDQLDRWACSLNSDGSFLVKSARHVIDRVFLPSSPVKTVWFKYIPRKVNIFIWLLRLDSLPVRWNLSARGIEVSSIVYPLCSNGVESLDHLFFGCTVAAELWIKVRVWLNCGMSNFSSWDSFIVWLEGVLLSNSFKDRIVAVVCTLLWAI